MATGKLAEVEEDAIYIAERRFRDQMEEYTREKEKLEKKQLKVKDSGKDK
jgi:hypothetical protein